MNFEEFNRLIHNAYVFLEVNLSQEVLEYIFKITDRNIDGYISYGEYFDAV